MPHGDESNFSCEEFRHFVSTSTSFELFGKIHVSILLYEDENKSYASTCDLKKIKHLLATNPKLYG